MNTILILIDSCNRHYLSSYGCKDVSTPNIGELADRGVVFTNHFIGSAPCMPARREMMSGRQDFLFRHWWHMEPFDNHVAVECRKAGAVTQMITDHYHYWESGAHGYMEGFEGLEMVRGNECDYWKTAPQTVEPDWVKAMNKHRPGQGSRYYRNVAHFTSEEDFFSPTVFRKGAEWLEANYHKHGDKDFFLQIESFDVHEPFHVPEPYRSMYTDDLNPEYTCWPPYQNDAERLKFLDSTSMGELEYIRAQYKGKLTMLDKALGQVWAVMDKHRMWDDTMVILTSDHGHDLAEGVSDLSEIDSRGRDRTLRVPWGKQHPHYLSHANIPLIVWHPELMNGGKRIDSITCSVDLYDTVLQAVGCRDIQPVNSRSILPLLAGASPSRDFAYWGTYGEGICCTDGEYVLLQGANSESPLFFYSEAMSAPEAECGRFIPGVDWPVWRFSRESRFDFPSILYRRDDPLFAERNIIDEKPDTAERMRRHLRERITEDGCPSEQLDRLGLR
jgi:arylsulfatase A-like enzyme